MTPQGAVLFATAMFALCAVSNALYWLDVQNTLGIAAVARNPWLLKNAELTGIINTNSFRYFFRNSTLVAVSLTLAVYLAPRTRLPKLLLALFVASVLVGERRDPMLVALGCVAGVAVVRTRSWRRLAVGIGAMALAFLALAAVLLVAINVPVGGLGPVVFGYSVGHLSSFQAMLDGLYPIEPQHLLEHAFYFVYSLLKYVDPTLAPQVVAKPWPLAPLLPNTYTFLAEYYLDMGVAGLLVFPPLVGAVMSLSHSLATRRGTLVATVFFATVYSASIRSFAISDWGWFTIPFGVAVAFLAEWAIRRPAEWAAAALAAPWSRLAGRATRGSASVGVGTA